MDREKWWKTLSLSPSPLLPHPLCSSLSLSLSPFLLPKGFGVAAKSTQDCRHADPTTIIAFHQSDIGEYLRSEGTL